MDSDRYDLANLSSFGGRTKYLNYHNMLQFCWLNLTSACKFFGNKRVRCSIIKQHSCKYRVNRKHTQHEIWRFLGFFSMHEKETAVAVERVPWGKPSSRLNTTLLSWGIFIGGYSNLLGALIGIVTFGSTLITSHLGLVLRCNRHII